MGTQWTNEAELFQRQAEEGFQDSTGITIGPDRRTRFHLRTCRTEIRALSPSSLALASYLSTNSSCVSQLRRTLASTNRLLAAECSTMGTPGLLLQQ